MPAVEVASIQALSAVRKTCRGFCHPFLSVAPDRHLGTNTGLTPVLANARPG